MEQLETGLRTTALYHRHCALGAKMVEFSGWKMPVYYQGIIPEHHAVRTHVGLFDVSHMGRILVEGPDAEPFLDFISTNTIAGKPDASATYTVWSMASGGTVDDVIVYKRDTTHFFVIANAGNRDKDLAHLLQESKSFDVKISTKYSEEGILALQGPSAMQLMSQLFPEAKALPHMRFSFMNFEGQQVIVSNTGYTGEQGVEIYASNASIVRLWDRLMQEGASYGIVPVGLGARDTLRLEMGYALYGHELSEEIAANESVSAWTVKWKKEKFLGKEALECIEHSPTKRMEYGVVLVEPGIARAGYAVLQNGERIGLVTSGTLSPTLNQAIAIILTPQKLHEGDLVGVQIRDRVCQGKVVKLPFRHAALHNSPQSH